MLRRTAAAALSLALLTGPLLAQEAGNLLRNAAFQDDWLTLLPENKNHHGCYSSEFYNRRDYNPDGWTCQGRWEWLKPDAPWGQRRLVVRGPATLSQRVNWVLVHDARRIGSMADAGGFPSVEPQRSLRPERLVRDLTFWVRLGGKDVPEKGGRITVALCPPGQITIADPLGTVTPPTVVAEKALPAGTFHDRWVTVTVPAADWLKAVKEAAQKDPKEAAEAAKSGPVLPGTVSVAIEYTAKSGTVEVERAELTESASPPNLLANGDFEEMAEGEKFTAPYPKYWGRPS